MDFKTEFIKDNLHNLSVGEITEVERLILIAKSRKIGISAMRGCEVCGDSYDNIVRRGMHKR